MQPLNTVSGSAAPLLASSIDTDVSMPPWAPDLPSLGEIDSGVVNPNDQLAPADSVPEGTTPDDSIADVPSTTEG